MNAFEFHISDGVLWCYSTCSVQHDRKELVWSAAEQIRQLRGLLWLTIRLQSQGSHSSNMRLSGPRQERTRIRKRLMTFHPTVADNIEDNTGEQPLHIDWVYQVPFVNDDFNLLLLESLAQELMSPESEIFGDSRPGMVVD